MVWGRGWMEHWDWGAGSKGVTWLEGGVPWVKAVPKWEGPVDRGRGLKGSCGLGVRPGGSAGIGGRGLKGSHGYRVEPKWGSSG